MESPENTPASHHLDRKSIVGDEVEAGDCYKVQDVTYFSPRLAPSAAPRGFRGLRGSSKRDAAGSQGLEDVRSPTTQV